ncbi:polysaccharide deacetylase family protein [Spiribacter sp. C176]|uniref:Polysaccharide deacetylase family protein n=1 Tax=Spiribacter salilacus TaxID=2664894 RepID=A0A6N7QUV8_9GAMM|nr:polysaccharide deacetylase family protein [Spiribacter salilacus]MRH78938.1 polysaccharide deacetylase family protein [Spiribacter salilacus]
MALALSAVCAAPMALMAADQATVLMYHRVGESAHPSTNVTADQFAEHLAYLAENDYTVVSLEEVVAWLEQGASLPPRAVAITFDDAYSSVGAVAHDMLRERDWPYTVFVNSKAIDSNYGGYVGWSRMREMAAQGARFANHTHTHAPLQTLTNAQIQAELNIAQTRLVEELGDAAHQSPPLLAYPYGEYNLSVMEHVAALGYVAFGQQSGALWLGSDRRALPRFAMNERFAEMDGFALKVQARPLPVRSSQPIDPVRESAEAPALVVTLEQSDLPVHGLSCFYGSERLEPEWVEPGLTFKVQGEADLPVGRSRYNCTMPVGDGRFWWFTQLWIYGAAGS